MAPNRIQHLLAHAVARRGLARPPCLHQHTQRFHSTTPRSRCNFHLGATSRMPLTPRRLAHWHILLQHRCFADSTASKEGDATPLPGLGSDLPDGKPKRSLHSSVHYILKRIPAGRMNEEDIQKARAFLSIVSKWHNEEGARLSEALLERIYEEQQSNRKFDVVIGSEMYNICLGAWNKSNADGSKIVQHVESIIERMEERFSRGRADNDTDSISLIARPDRYTYNCLINAYSNCDDDVHDKVERILDRMNALAEDSDDGYRTLIRPDAYTYNSLMNYYATRKNQQPAAQRAEDLLLYMSERSRQGEAIQLDATSFNIVLKAWYNSGGGLNAAERAETVLRMMIRMYSQGIDNVRPDAASFSTVISAYSRVDPEDASVAVEKALALVDELEGLRFDSTANINSCYNAAANVIVKSGLHDAIDRVKELMQRMKNMDAVSDQRMYTSFIEAYAKEGSDESFRTAKELLSQLMGGPEPELEPSVVPFNILLDTLLKGNSPTKIEQAEELMSTMDELGENARPDLVSYSMMLSSLSRSRVERKAQKAADYLRKMLKSYSSGYENAKPDSYVFNCTIGMLARSKQQEWAENAIYRTLMAMENQRKQGNTLVIPDTIAYNMVIGKLAQSGTKENAKKVMSLLTTMEGSQSEEGIAPDIITYTNVLRIQEKVNPLRAAYTAASCLERAISREKVIQMDKAGLRALMMALSKSHKLEHAAMARKAWEWMEDPANSHDDLLDPDLCNLVLIAYSKARGERAAEEALAFLTERITRYKDGKSKILPTVVGFSATITALSKTGRVDDALRLLEIMKEVSRSRLSRGPKDRIQDIRPDEGCYASMLGPLARGKAANAPSHALKVLQRMKEDLGTVPTRALNAAISTCSRNDSPKAVGTAFDLLKLGRESKSCDADTYGLVIKTCMSTGDDDTKFRLVEPLFKQCASYGLVGRMVMKEIRHFRQRLVANEQLPAEWSANAKDQ